MARPQIEIDKDIFEGLCKIQCTLVEIAAVFDCCDETIERWCKREYEEGFADVYKKKSSGGKIALRRYQFKMAETNVAMAIWLGKQWLGQTDKQETVSTERVQVVNNVPEND
jgi:hypothetical protein